MQLLAFGEREFDLGDATIVEIELERHDGHALAFFGDRHLVNFTGMQKQAPLAAGLMLEKVSGTWVFGNVGVDQPDSPSSIEA